jgi:hypothetical protein
MIWAPLSISLAIGGIAVAARYKTQTWAHPAVLFALFWFVMTALPILGVPELTVSIHAMLYILGLSLAFALPALATNWHSSVAIARSRSDIASPYSQPILLWLVVGLPVLWIVLMGINLQRQGFDLSKLATNPLEIGCLYLGGRYNGTLVPTVFAQAATVLNYVAVSLAGVLLASRKGVVVRLAVLAITFVPSILTVLVMADKGTIFLAAAFFYGGVVVARLTSGDTALINWTTVGTCVLAVFVLVPLIMLAMLNRGGGACSDIQRTVDIVSALRGGGFEGGVDPMQDSVAMRTSGMQFALRSYAFGHIFAFSDWVEHYFSGIGSQPYTDPAGMTWGYWTFMAIGKLVYPAYHLPPGYYTEYILYNGVLQSNIYTMFRGMIYDFGIIGSWIFMLIVGAFSSFVYKRMLENRIAPISQAVYILVVGCIYSSYIFSPFTWNSVYAAPVGVAIVLALLGFWDRRQSKL